MTRRTLFSLIPEWRHCLRFNSVQASLLLAFLSAVQADVVPLIQPVVPATVWPYVSSGLALLIILLRLRAQPALQAPPPPTGDKAA